MEPREEVQLDLKANLKRGIEYVGGKLQITNEAMYFTPHSFNVQKKDLVISVSEIKTIEAARILGVSPNGVVIHLKDNHSYKFTIGLPMSNKRQEVIDFIHSLIG